TGFQTCALPICQGGARAMPYLALAAWERDFQHHVAARGTKVIDQCSLCDQARKEVKPGVRIGMSPVGTRIDAGGVHAVPREAIVAFTDVQLESEAPLL